jgi:hypothetical protein
MLFAKSLCSHSRAQNNNEVKVLTLIYNQLINQSLEQSVSQPASQPDIQIFLMYKWQEIAYRLHVFVLHTPRDTIH